MQRLDITGRQDMSHHHWWKSKGREGDQVLWECADSDCDATRQTLSADAVGKVKGI